MHRWSPIGVIGLLTVMSLAIAACGNGPADDPVSGAADRGSAVEANTGAASPDAAAASVAGDLRTYTVDAAGSEVYWRIYRAGLMARLGHNHVISVGELNGTVAMGDDPASARWELAIAVDGLIVDNPELRARYGEDFASVPDEDAKTGTKRNMLSEDVLDGANYPEIRLSGTGFTGTLQDAELATSLNLLGRTIDLTLPATITIDGDELTVSGEFRLTHEELGMKPFTALGGAMAVGENIDFTYRIHAVAGD